MLEQVPSWVMSTQLLSFEDFVHTATNYVGAQREASLKYRSESPAVLLRFALFIFVLQPWRVAGYHICSHLTSEMELVALLMYKDAWTHLGSPVFKFISLNLSTYREERFKYLE